MPFLTPGQTTPLITTLTRDGLPCPLTASSDTLTGQLFDVTGLTPLTSTVDATASDAGAVWNKGVIAIAFDDAETTTITADSVLLVVISAAAGMFQIPVTVDSINNRSALFPSRAFAIASFRESQARLPPSLSNLVSSATDNDVWLAYRAAEADLGRRLGVPLQATSIFYDQPSESAITALNGEPYLIEPGYDLPPNFFGVDNWGTLTLRQKPVIEIQEMTLIYPNKLGATFTVPLDWIRVDNKYGQLHVFPSAQLVSSPISIWIMQAQGAGHNIPHMIRIRYRAGLQNILRDYPDLLQLATRGAALGLLQDGFLPQSNSLSVDGLSQSASADLSAYQTAYNEKVAILKNRLNGPVWSVL